MPKLHIHDAADAALKLALALADRTPVDFAELSADDSSDLPDWCIPNFERIHRIVEGHQALYSDLPIEPSPADCDTLLTAARRGVKSHDLLQVSWGPLIVREKVGRGSFGDVYRAWDPKLEREVALKLVPTATPNHNSSTSFDEGRRLARVRHPNVVSVYGVEQVEGRIGLWMEFIEGPTLANEVTIRGPLEPEEASRVGIDVCRALSAVHDAGLLHRDVKAHNVMRDSDGRVVLGDFGTGHELETSSGPDGHLAGTPLYLAPETLAGSPPSTASDQYSVGVLLYYLATGDYPVGGDNLAEIREAHARSRKVSLAERRPDVPTQFVDIIGRALEPDPNDRYATVADLGGALTTFVDSQTASPPAATLETAATTTRTRRWLAASVTVGILVAAGWLFRPGSSPELGQEGLPTPAARRISAGLGLIPYGPFTADFRYFGCTDRETLDLALCEWYEDDYHQVRRVTNRSATGDDARYYWGAFSPDGLEVAYVAERSDSRFDGIQEARIIGIDGAGDRFLREGFDGVKHVWLHSWTKPDEILAHLLMHDTSTKLALLSVGDGSMRTILEGDPDGFGSFARSPDGRYLLHTPLAEGTSERDIAILDLNTSVETVVVTHEANGGGATWMPEGSGIVFHSDYLDPMGLWRLGVRNGKPEGEPEWIRDIGHRRVNALGLASDGSWYYSVEVDPAEIVEAVLGSDSERPAVTTRLSPGERDQSRAPAWSLGGRHLAYVSRTGGGNSVVVQDTETGEEHDFPLEPLDAFKGVIPRWRPDDDALGLVVLSMVDYTNELRVIETQTGNVIRQRSLGNIDELGEIVDFDWLSDDVIVVQRRGQILLVDLVTGIEHLAYARDDAEIRSMRLSPDRATVAVTSATDGMVSLSIMPATGGDLRQLYLVDAGIVAPMEVHDWTTDSSGIFFTKRDVGPIQFNPRVRLWRIDLGSDEPVPLSVAGSGLESVDAHPDGTRIAFKTGTRRREMWVLDDVLTAGSE